MRIGLIGWYGHNNAGDERMLHCLRTFFSGDELVVAEDRHDLATQLETLNSCEYILLGGGGLIQRRNDRYQWLIENLTPRFGCVGISVESSRRDARRVLKLIKEKAEFILVRDTASRELLDRHWKVITGHDLTFLYPFDTVEVREDDVCGVNLRDWHYWNAERGGRRHSIMSALHKRFPTIRKIYPLQKWDPARAVSILESCFSRLIPVPLYCEGVQTTDAQVLGKYCSDVRNEFLPDLYERCRYFVGMRVHSTIFACQMGIPFVSLSYGPKNAGFCNDAGMSRYLVDIYDLARLEPTITSLCDARSEIRQQLLEHTCKANKEITDIMDSLHRLITGRRRGRSE